jgi:hypothetical protein
MTPALSGAPGRCNRRRSVSFGQIRAGSVRAIKLAQIA